MFKKIIRCCSIGNLDYFQRLDQYLKDLIRGMIKLDVEHRSNIHDVCDQLRKHLKKEEDQEDENKRLRRELTRLYEEKLVLEQRQKPPAVIEILILVLCSLMGGLCYIWDMGFIQDLLPFLFFWAFFQFLKINRIVETEEESCPICYTEMQQEN